MELVDTSDEADEGHGILWHPVVWPGGVVEMCDCQGTFVRLWSLIERKGGRNGEGGEERGQDVRFF